MREMRGQFQKLFRTEQGIKFFGELNNPLKAEQENKYRTRRILNVSKKALVTTGDVVTADEASYLVSLAAEYTDMRQFKVYPITHRLNWTRREDTIDTVTGIPRDNTLVILSPALPVVVEYGESVDNLNLETEKYRVFTGSDVRVGDQLGAWLVRSKLQVNGLNMLEVS